MNVIDKIKKLPDDIINIIKEFIPKKQLVFTNHENYKLYHKLIRVNIQNYENYIRDMIRRDNDFVFIRILEENYKRWFEIKHYRYKNMIFKNYLYFIINYSIENESSNCRKIMNRFLKEFGLCKNLHKKNIVKYIN